MSGVKLSAKWQLDAALLSRPVDLTSLVSLSRSHPQKFTEDDTIHRLVSNLLNEKNLSKSDKDTKLDVLNILANVAGGDKIARAEVRVALGGISEWFDEYIATEEADPTIEPELHKAMVLLLARCWDYKLKTEDVLELTQGNRRIALCTVVGLLEDGETYSTVLKQRQRPTEGQMAQWEHELIIQRFEKPLLLQICRLLRGFTHPGTYFEASTEELALYSVERFSDEINTLLEITLRSRLVEKLCVAMYSCIFEDHAEDDGIEDVEQRVLEETDHVAVMAVHAFLQNLYFYASHNHDEFRRHMLVDTLLIPRLILPYLNCCTQQAMVLNNRAEAYSDVLEGDSTSTLALDHHPNLVKGIAASLRTLIIASFRAPPTQYVMSLLRRLNPTASMLKASSFCLHHHQIYSLLCLLNVNMGALDLSRQFVNDNSVVDAYRAHSLLHEMATIYSKMDKNAQAQVYKRVMAPGSLPICRDTPSYVAIMSVLHGGAAGQLEYCHSARDAKDGDEDEDVWDSRAEAKRAHAERMEMARQAVEADADAKTTTRSSFNSKGKNSSAFEVALATAQDIEDRRLEAKEAKASGLDPKDNKGANVAESKSDQQQIRGEGYRLLGDLPSLPGGKSSRDVQVALALELPGESTKPVPKMVFGGHEMSDETVKRDSDIPEEFLCAINGHVMKDPVRSKSTGVVYERATIEIWLKTRGSVCPITHETLTPDDLEPDTELRKRIMRYHIQSKARPQIKASNPSADDDDLYNF
eukprot:CAMPEP_0185017436 /NCGR_PEP_ID=MMETSP1103-20130426/388_1 /TAXON_ID=36769 /ORGANISM="Paraphysomonas bandaiensis, Strain Caron Lab Isolate" /LENGTH=753 /DNA_ID=CAMNT_0027546853 /DNA_START=39 /DNA_END=2300 /DNA_ORIENTATION=+